MLASVVTASSSMEVLGPRWLGVPTEGNARVSGPAAVVVLSRHTRTATDAIKRIL